VRVRFTAEAEQDMTSAARYYAREGSADVGSAFIEEIERACRLLQQEPIVGKIWSESARRLVLRRFPFNLVYRVIADEIQVIAIAHHRRRPGYWRA
jgi:toxin ParE1/3/4